VAVELGAHRAGAVADGGGLGAEAGVADHFLDIAEPVRPLAEVAAGQGAGVSLVAAGAGGAAGRVISAGAVGEPAKIAALRAWLAVATGAEAALLPTALPLASTLLLATLLLATLLLATLLRIGLLLRTLLLPALLLTGLLLRLLILIELNRLAALGVLVFLHLVGHDLRTSLLLALNARGVPATKM
jgi:hypothetical protein